MAISFNGYNVLNLSISCNNVAIGDPVIIKTNGAVSQSATNEKFMGICTQTREGVASIQTQGYVEVSYSGTAPAVGFAKLCSNGSHGVKTATSDADAREYLVLKCDTKNHRVGIML